jgi:hypothetical protein
MFTMMLFMNLGKFLYSVFSIKHMFEKTFVCIM